MAESIKNGLIGKVHLPHSHMIDHGIQAFTYEAQYNEGYQVSRGFSNRTPLYVHNSMMQIFERIIRGHDHLDESLHAGYYFYILVGTQRFIGLDAYIYPLLILTFSYYLPTMLTHI